jgi:predicted phosphodiesterase
MRVAVLSDVHANAYALATVLDDVERAGAEQVWFAGDAFGYHPWATDTYSLLAPATGPAVLGNHDSWLIGKQSAPADFAGTTAMYNAAQLRNERPEALSWLRSLPALLTQEIEGWTVTITHGTPASPLLGRYYPDDRESHEWLPRAGEILVLGQTHHPLLRGRAEDGLLLNPGSVGQPRDGDPRPSWALLDLATGRAQLRRSSYDLEAMVKRLRAIGWDEHVIAALERRRGDGPAPVARTTPARPFIYR